MQRQTNDVNQTITITISTNVHAYICYFIKSYLWLSQFDHTNQMITLLVNTLTSFHCIKRLLSDKTGWLYIFTLFNSNSNYLLKLAKTDFDNHETVKFGCGCVEDSHEWPKGTNYCARHTHNHTQTVEWESESELSQLR